MRKLSEGEGNLRVGGSGTSMGRRVEGSLPQALDHQYIRLIECLRINPDPWNVCVYVCMYIYGSN